jgi:hypothetical protein
MPSPSVDQLAARIRALSVRMAPGAPGPSPGRRRVWARQHWPWGRRRLLCRYDACLLAAAEMLEAQLPPRRDWTRPGLRGWLFGDDTRSAVEEALEAVGFCPFGPPTEDDLV